MRSSRRLWIARRAIDLVMLVLLIAGLLKAFDITEFASAMRTWTLFPRWVPLAMAPVIPAVEIGVALAWFLDLWRRSAVLVATILLALFTGIYALHLVIGEAPRCGCLGVLEAFKNAEHEAKFILSRNGVMIATLVVAGRTLLARRLPPARHDPFTDQPSARPAPAR